MCPHTLRKQSRHVLKRQRSVSEQSHRMKRKLIDIKLLHYLPNTAKEGSDNVNNNNQTGPRKIMVLIYGNYYTINRHQYVLRNVLERSSKQNKTFFVRTKGKQF